MIKLKVLEIGIDLICLQVIQNHFVATNDMSDEES